MTNGYALEEVLEEGFFSLSSFLQATAPLMELRAFWTRSFPLITQSSMSGDLLGHPGDNTSLLGVSLESRIGTETRCPIFFHCQGRVLLSYHHD